MQLDIVTPREGSGPIASDKPADNASPALIEYISFAVGSEHYGVEIMAVREIKGWSGVTHLPEQPQCVRGVMNLRGVMVPIVDLRCRFGHGLTDASPLHVAIIVQIGGNSVGLLADRVLDIVAFETGKIQPVPKVGKAGGNDCLSGLISLDDELIAVIDLNQVVSFKDGSPLAVAVQGAA